MKRFVSLILTFMMIVSAVPFNVSAIPSAVEVYETIEAAPMPEVEEDIASDEEKTDAEETDNEIDDEQKSDEQKATLSADTCRVYGTVSLPEGMTFDKDVPLSVWIYGSDGSYKADFLLLMKMSADIP